MAHFYFDMSDFGTSDSAAIAIGDNHKNSNGPLKTTAAEAGTANLGTTAYDVSSFMQGAALHKSPGILLDDFNQTISSDLAGMFYSEGGPEKVLGGRRGLVPTDVVEREPYPDSIWEAASTASQSPGSGGGTSEGTNASGGGVPGGDMGEAVQAILDNPNIALVNTSEQYLREGKVKPCILNCIWFLASNMWIKINNMYRPVDDGYQHPHGRAVDIEACGPKDQNGEGQDNIWALQVGAQVEALYGVIDQLPAGNRPTEAVIGPYVYGGSSDIHWSSNAAHANHIHIGYHEDGQLGDIA